MSTPTKHYEMLQINSTDGTEYLLPYYHFLGRELSRCGQTSVQTLILDFALRTVRIEGSGLEKITKKLQNRTIKTIPDNSTGTDNQQPSITRIDVVCRGYEETVGEMS